MSPPAASALRLQARLKGARRASSHRPTTTASAGSMSLCTLPNTSNSTRGLQAKVNSARCRREDATLCQMTRQQAA